MIEYAALLLVPFQKPNFIQDIKPSGSIAQLFAVNTVQYPLRDIICYNPLLEILTINLELWMSFAMQFIGLARNYLSNYDID